MRTGLSLKFLLFSETVTLSTVTLSRINGVLRLVYGWEVVYCL